MELNLAKWGNKTAIPEWLQQIKGRGSASLLLEVFDIKGGASPLP